MFFKKLVAMFVTVCVGIVSTHETRTLPYVGNLGTLATSFLQQQPSANSPNAANNELLAQFPFQLSTPQFGTLVSLFNNVSQFLGRPQSGQQTTTLKGEGPQAEPKVLHPVSPNSIITLPFDGLNVTEFSWLLEGILANGTSLNQSPKPGNEGIRPEPKNFGGGNTSNITYSDLNFLTALQLLNLFRR